jgi:hypothetical protein
MTAITKGAAVAVLHVLIVLSIGGKLVYDRSRLPRAWVRTASVDPDLPIRGRYMALRLQVQAPWLNPNDNYSLSSVTLEVENDNLVARKSHTNTGLSITSWRNPRPSPPNPQQPGPVFLDESVLFFLPEHADFPRIKSGEELWAEVTIPKKGPPRPIQLALKHGTEWRPLTYR